MANNQSTTHAVLIGIDQYDDPQAPNLLGARNDAIAWWRLLTSDLGVSAANITVLASPPITPDELGGAGVHSTLTEARGSNIETAIKSLSERLSGGDVRGVLCYSGHGVTTLANPEDDAEACGEDLAICPSDTSIDGDGSGVGQLSGMIGFTKLHSWIDDNARKNLTVVLDTCHNAPARDVPHRHLLGRRDRRRVTQQAHDKLLARYDQPIGGRVILAAGHDQSAEELRTTHGWQGAMSHALISLLPRWRCVTSAGLRHYEVSHHELIYRTRHALTALGAEQQAQLLGRAMVGELPVFKLGTSSRASEVSREPNRPAPGRQYPINGLGILLAELIQPGATDPFMYVVVAGAYMTRAAQTWGSSKITFPPGFGSSVEAWYATQQPFDSNKDVEFRVVVYEEDWADFKNNSLVKDMVAYPSPAVQDTAGPVEFGTLQPSESSYYLQYREPIYGNEYEDWFLVIPRALLDHTNAAWSSICWGVADNGRGGLTELPGAFNVTSQTSLPHTITMSTLTALPSHINYTSWRMMHKV